MPARSHFFASADGLRLHIRVHGEAGGDRLPIVCLPGLTRNARDFDALAEHLIAGSPSPRLVLAFDYRGRGLSDSDPDWRNYNLAAETQDVLTGLASLRIDRAAFIGTSRGGLILHLIATLQPDLLDAVVLNDVGPELGLDGLIRIRKYLADRAFPSPLTWPEAIQAQRAIHGEAFPALTDADWERMAHALYRERNGTISLDFDPALVKTVEAMDLSKPLPDLWPQFEQLAEAPLLVIRGENSELLAPGTLAAMHRRHPTMQSLTVRGQGHAPLLETGSLPDELLAFFDRPVR